MRKSKDFIDQAAADRKQLNEMIALSQQPGHDLRAEKAGAACDEKSHS